MYLNMPYENKRHVLMFRLNLKSDGFVNERIEIYEIECNIHVHQKRIQMELFRLAHGRPNIR